MSQENNVTDPEEWANRLADRDRAKAKENNNRLQSGGGNGTGGGMEARVAKLESDVKLLDSKFEAVKNRAYDIIREKFMDKSNIDPAMMESKYSRTTKKRKSPGHTRGYNAGRVAHPICPHNILDNGKSQ